MNYNDYRSQYGGSIEVIGGVLYDTVAYVSAASVALTYFTVVRNNLALSNIELAGTFPSPKAFLIRSVSCKIMQRAFSSARAAAGQVQPGAIDNIAQLVNTGVFEFTIGSKRYIHMPLWMMPGGSSAQGVAAGDGDVADPGEIQDWATNGKPDTRNVRTLSKPIFIGPQVNFVGVITWPAAITLAGGVNVNVQIRFEGDQLRPVQ